MKILITGATGCIGNRIAKQLGKNSQHEIVIATRKQSEELSNFENVIVDLNDFFPSELPKVDYVVHAAQSRMYRDFPEFGNDIFSVNVASTQKLLDYSCKNGVQGFCFLSSGSVYEPYNNEMSVNATRLAPTTANGLTKLAAEHIVNAYSSHLNINIPRIFFPYGPGQIDRLIPGLINRIMNNHPVDLSGDNGFSFAPLYIEDIAKIIDTTVGDLSTGTYNLASPEVMTFRQIVTDIGEALGTDPIFNISDKKQPDIIPQVDSVKLSGLLDSFTPFKEGIRKTVECHLR